MSRFVQVPAAVLRDRLTAAGFSLVSGSGEEIYVRVHNRDARYVVKVYSSIQRGAGGNIAECGDDAIRVVAIWTDDKFSYPPRQVPIFKSARVYRTGTVEGVLDRMIERAREAYAACNKHRMRGAA